MIKIIKNLHYHTINLIFCRFLNRGLYVRNVRAFSRGHPQSPGGFRSLLLELRSIPKLTGARCAPCIIPCGMILNFCHFGAIGNPIGEKY